jgi:hypothetical protein
VAQKLLFESLRYLAPEPSMIDARDALLIADLIAFNGAHRTQLWSIFAKRGLGASAAASPGSFAIAPPDNGWRTAVFAAADTPANRYATTPQKVLFFDNLESGAPGWLLQGTDGAGSTSPLWHLSTLHSSSSTHAFYYGDDSSQDYDTGFANYGSLISPPIQLPGIHAGQAIVLEWDQRRATDDPFFFDGGFVRIIEAGTSDRTQVAFVQSTETFFGEPTFLHQKVNIGKFAGKRVRIEFYMDTFDANFNGGEGWFVDNVKVSVIGSLPVIRVTDPRLPEGASGTTRVFPFVVSLSARSLATISVSFNTSNGTAAAPGDYTARGLTTLTFTPGQTSKTVNVTVRGDNTTEGTETFFLNLRNPTNAKLGETRGIGTIVTDDCTDRHEC